MQDQLTRQQRRALERSEGKTRSRAWKAINAGQRAAPTGKYLPHGAFLPFFVLPAMAEIVQTQTEHTLVKILQGSSVPENGIRVRIRILMGSDGMQSVISDAMRCPPEQPSHVALMGDFEPDHPEDLTYASHPEVRAQLLDQPCEIRIPFDILLDPRLPRRASGLSWLYHICFDLSEKPNERIVDPDLVRVMWNGYVGTTSNPVTFRMREHYQMMKNGEGYLLHDVWRQIRMSGLRHRIIAFLSTWSTSEDEIYSFEERAISKATLTPQGLNMIQGGRAGIRQLKDLGYTEARLGKRQETLSSAIRTPKAGRARFQGARLRKQASGRFSMTPGHWSWDQDY